MVYERMPRAGLCALYLLFTGCSSKDAPGTHADAGAPSEGGASGTPLLGGFGGASVEAGAPSRGGTEASGGAAPSTGGSTTAGGRKHEAGANSGPPPAVDGQSIYALECHGESKDCNLATVPCFGVASPTPNVAAGWACANRCDTDADCSSAPSGAEARAGCVSFTSASHCVLVCKNENLSFTCPQGMACYTPQKSPIGYCLWQ